MALSALCFSLMGVFVKLLVVDGIPPLEVVFWRGLLCMPLTLAVMPRNRASLLGTRTGVLLLRGLFGFTGLLLYVMALAEIDYSIATALLYTHPMFTALFAAILLRERLPRGGAVAMALCLAGAVVILDPRMAGSLAGGLMALGAGIASGMAYTLVRGLSRTESTYTIVLAFHVVAAVVAGVAMVPVFVLPDGSQWLWLLGVVLFSQAGQVFLTQGLAAERAGTATTVSYLSVVFAAFWGWTLFSEALTLAMAGGVGLLILGLLLIGRTPQPAE